MNKGDYVRTKDGILWKPNKIEEIEGKWFFDDYYFYDKEYIKSSPNIIDLIEVGDYVNGLPVIHKENNELVCGLLVRYKEEDIKSIVTHEQFSAMEYKVESEVK